MTRTAHKITVSALDVPRHTGDWHDKPARWQAVGPGDELQIFSTKKDALKYATCRRRTDNATDATRAFIRL